MATTTTNTPPAESPSAAEEMTVKAALRRYEGLLTVRSKATKGKGAWYWSHLEPMLVHNTETGRPKAVKLRCSLCDAVFSASNPSRTASEHLKRGTCPNFVSQLPKPISSISPPGSAPPHATSPTHRKRAAVSPPYPVSALASSSSLYQINPLSIVDPARFLPRHHSHLVLSGGKDDLGALALLEDRVKKLKSPKASPGPSLTKTQIDSALDHLTDWVYESYGSVSFSTLDHPKFRAFLSQVGLPGVSRRRLSTDRLDLKYEETKIESEGRIRDAMFFQIASDGWKVRPFDPPSDVGLVNLTVNLPNGATVYRRAVLIPGSVPPRYAEEVTWDTITTICGDFVHQCVGVVADRFNSKALRNLESQHHWMVNLPCQSQGVASLIKHFEKDLPLFRSACAGCLKLARFVNNDNNARKLFNKYQTQNNGYSSLLRVPPKNGSTFPAIYTLMEDVLSSNRTLQMVVIDDSYKATILENPESREVSEMVSDAGFWNQIEAVHSFVKMIRKTVKEIERERPLVGECLPIWEEVRGKIRDWGAKFRVSDGSVEKIIEKRFKKNYHPAWAAAYVLDPLYLIRDSTGKYLPPFKNLTPDQEKDVDRLIRRLVTREEAHIALMELMKWRTEGLDPDYAKAVQMKERDPITGKMKIANPQSSRIVWETYLTEFKSLGRVAVRLIFLHATSCGFRCNQSLMKWACSQGRSRSAMEKVQKMIFIAANSKLERREYWSDDEKDDELLLNGEDVLNDVFADTTY